MTGTGTQADPYIVSTWEEFLSVCYVSTIAIAYIKWADCEIKEIDFNEIAPEGYTNTITISAEIDFNGWTLRNFRSSAEYPIRLRSDVADHGRYNKWTYYIKNLNLINIKWERTGSSGSFISTEGGTNYYPKRFSLRNCVFNGRIDINPTSSTNWFYVFNNSGAYTDIELKCCKVVIEGQTNSTLCMFGGNSGQQDYVYDSDIVIDNFSGLNFYVTGTYSYIQNSRVRGSVAGSSVTISSNSSSTANLIDLECSSALSYTGGLSVYNSDKASGSGSSFIACTDDQIHDAAYLRSIGFPIGVD